MGIDPEVSHHEMGHGQNEIDFRYSSALQAADNAATFKWVVQAIANMQGLVADFHQNLLMISRVMVCILI